MSGYIATAKSVEYETPKELYEKLDAIFFFAIDGACTEKNCKATWASTEDNPLPWSRSTFCNPPYGKQLPDFLKKAAEDFAQYQADIVLLIPSSTEVKSWFDYIYDDAKYIINLRGRLKFEINGIPEKNCIGKGSVLVIYTVREIRKELEALNIGKVIELNPVDHFNHPIYFDYKPEVCN